MPRDVQDIIDTLQKQLDAFGMTNQQILVYEANLKGATAAQLKLIEAQAKEVEQLQKQKTAVSDTRQRMEGFRAAAGTMASVAEAGRGSMAALGSAVQDVGRMIPTPLGVAAAAAGGVLAAVGAQADQFREQVKAAFLEAAQGAGSLGRAVESVRIARLTEGLGQAAQAMAGGGGVTDLLRSLGRTVAYALPFIPAQTLARQDIHNALADAQRVEERMQRLQNEPAFLGARRELAWMQANRLSGDIAQDAGTRAARAATAARVLSEGRGGAEAALAADRMARVLDYARQTGRTVAEAGTILQPLFDLEAPAQRLRLAAETAAQVTERNRTAGEQYLTQQRQLQRARDVGTLGDVAYFREQARLAEGLSASVSNLFRLPQLLEEGSVAAAEAVQRAEQERAAADPEQIPELLRAQNDLGRQQVDYGRQVAEALQRLGAGGGEGV